MSVKIQDAQLRRRSHPESLAVVVSNATAHAWCIWGEKDDFQTICAVGAISWATYSGTDCRTKIEICVKQTIVCALASHICQTRGIDFIDIHLRRHTRMADMQALHAAILYTHFDWQFCFPQILLHNLFVSL